MKSKFICISIFLFLFISGISQAQSSGKNMNLSGGGAIPIGNFSQTHLPGAQILFEYSKGRFGKLLKSPDPSIGFVLNGGLSFFSGKREKISAYTFRYSNYAVLHLYGGAMIHAAKNWHFAFSGGPAISYYRNNIRFNLGAELQSTWYWKQQWGVGPTLGILKENGADPLLMSGIRIAYAF